MRNGFNGVSFALDPAFNWPTRVRYHRTDTLHLSPPDGISARTTHKPAGVGAFSPLIFYRSPYNLPHAARRVENIQKVNFRTRLSHATQTS